MNVDEVMAKNVVACSADTHVSEILNMMKKNRINQMPVLAGGDKLHSKGDVLGIVTLNKIILSEVDPAKTKAKAFMRSCPKLAPGDNLKRAAKMLLDSNLRALPVVDGELVGMISEQDIMREVQIEGSAVDYAKKCMSVLPTDAVSKAKRIMALSNVSRVAVAGEKLDGIVGALDLIPLSRSWQRLPVRSASSTVAAKEKRGMGDANVKNFMHGAQILPYDSNVSSAVKILRGSEEVILQKDGEFYIITPKDILASYCQEVQTQLVQVAGIDEGDDTIAVAKIHEMAQELMQTLGKSIRVQPMKIYVKKHKNQGDNLRYSVKIELPTQYGIIVATKESRSQQKTYGDLLSAFQKELGDIERQVRKRIEMKKRPEQKWKAKRRAKEGC